MSNKITLLVNGTLLANQGNIFVIISNYEEKIRVVQSLIGSTMTIITFLYWIYTNWKAWRNGNKEIVKKIGDKTSLLSMTQLLTATSFTGCFSNPVNTACDVNADAIKALALTDPQAAQEQAQKMQTAVIQAQSKADMVAFLTHQSYVSAGICAALQITAAQWALKTSSSMTPAAVFGAIQILAAGFSFVAQSAMAVWLGQFIIVTCLGAVIYATYTEIREGKSKKDSQTKET